MPQEVKIISSGEMKGLNTSQRTANVNSLDTFIRCYNCYTKNGTIVKMRPWLYDSSITVTGSAGSSNGHGICYAQLSSATGYLILIGDKEIDYTTITGFNANGAFTYGAVTAITTLANSPNGGSSDYSFTRASDASSNDLLFFQNGSTNYNLHYINLGTLAYTHVADAHLAGTRAVCTNQGLTFAAVGGILYYSKIDDATDWDVTWLIKMPGNSKIIDLFTLNEFVVIFCDDAIYTLTGNSTTTFDLNKLSNVGIGFNSRVDGSEDECYYVDTNFDFRRLSKNANYGGISSSAIISDGILSPTEKDINEFASAKSDFRFAKYVSSKVYQKGNFVYFSVDFNYSNAGTSTLRSHTFVYNRDERTFTNMYIYYDTVTYPDTNRFVSSYASTKNGQNIPYTNSVLLVAPTVKGIYQLSQVPDATGVTQAVGTNYNAFSFYTGRITMGNNNLKTLQKIMFDFSTFGSVGDITLGITVYDEEETQIYGPASTSDYFTIDVNRTKWITLPRNLTSRAFYIRINTDYTGGLRLNKWAIQYVDNGSVAHIGG